MSQIRLNVVVTMDLNAQEFRLVGLALAGKLRGSRDVMEANQLSLRLMEQREHQLKELLEIAQGAATSARINAVADSSDPEEGDDL